MMAAAPDLAFDASALKRHFPGLADPQLHYLDNAATAQMPEVVLGALRRFEIEARANVHEGIHRRAKAATVAYQGARQRVAGFLGARARSDFHLWSDFRDQPAGACLAASAALPCQCLGERVDPIVMALPYFR